MAHKVINVRLSNALTLMKVEDKPSVVLVRRYGEKSWLVLFNVPRYKDRWGASQFRPAHVEMLSKEQVEGGHRTAQFVAGTRYVLDQPVAKEASQPGYCTIQWTSKELDAAEPCRSRHFTVYYGKERYDLSDYRYRSGAEPEWPEEAPKEKAQPELESAGAGEPCEAAQPEQEEVEGNKEGPELESAQAENVEFVISDQPLEKELKFIINTAGTETYCWVVFPPQSIPVGEGLSRALSGVKRRRLDARCNWGERFSSKDPATGLAVAKTERGK